MPSPLSVKNNFKSALFVYGGSALLFFALIYFVYQFDQGKKKAAPEKYSESKFLHLNAQLSKRTADLLEDQKKIAAESSAELQTKRAELQKKIFNQAVAQKIVTKKTVSAPAAQNQPAPTQAATQPKPSPVVASPAPQPTAPKKPRTTVS